MTKSSKTQKKRSKEPLYRRPSFARVRRRAGDFEAPTLCEVAGCKQPITGRKPYCIDHIDLLPQVQHLQLELAHREAEANKARIDKKWKHIDVQGTTAQEILTSLFGQVRTAAAVARDINLHEPEVVNYLMALTEAELVVKVPIATRNHGIKVNYALTPKEIEHQALLRAS